MQFPPGCFLESDHTGNPGSRLPLATKALAAWKRRGLTAPSNYRGGALKGVWSRKVGLSASELPPPLFMASLTKGPYNAAFRNPLKQIQVPFIERLLYVGIHRKISLNALTQANMGALCRKP